MHITANRSVNLPGARTRARVTKPSATRRRAQVYAGPTAEVIDKVLRKVPVVSDVVGIVDSVLSIFGSGAASTNAVRDALNREAEAFIGKFSDLIHAVSAPEDLEALAVHINRAASSISDGVSAQRIAWRLQAAMAEKATVLRGAASARVGAEMAAAIDALEMRKAQHVSDGELAVRQAIQAGDARLEAIANVEKGILAEKVRGSELAAKDVKDCIARLDELRNSVLAAAKSNGDDLGDLVATTQSREFSNRSSSASSRAAPRGTRTTTVVHPPAKSRK